jgi:hypothetical protein
MKTEITKSIAAIIKGTPAKILERKGREVIVSMSESQMSEAEMDEMKSTIEAAMPSVASVAEEEGALITISW